MIIETDDRWLDDPRMHSDFYVYDGIYREECRLVKKFGDHANRVNGRCEVIDGQSYQVTRYDCCGQIFRKTEING
mgnify:CR=1 FL=1